jgi:hypothetical protein
VKGFFWFLISRRNLPENRVCPGGTVLFKNEGEGEGDLDSTIYELKEDIEERIPTYGQRIFAGLIIVALGALCVLGFWKASVGAGLGVSTETVAISIICYVSAILLAPLAKTARKKLLVIFAVPIFVVSVLYFGEPLLRGQDLYEHRAWAFLIIPIYSLPGIFFSLLGLSCRLAIINKMLGK